MRDGSERRRAERRQYVAFVWYRLIANDDDEPTQEGIGHSTDLSMQGLGIVAPRALEMGRKFFMKIKAPKGTISAVAVVVNSREHEEGTYRIGFRFEILPPSDLPILSRMVVR